MLTANTVAAPAYYMEQGLGKRWMGTLFSICLIIAFGFVFNAVQSKYHHRRTTPLSFGWNETTQGIVIVVFTAFFYYGWFKTCSQCFN